MKLVDQWATVAAALPEGWDEVRLVLRPEQPDELGEAARVLGPMTVGRAGDTLSFSVRRAGGPSGPESARRLFGRLDDARVWCVLEVVDVVGAATDATADPAAAHDDADAPGGLPVTTAWDAAVAALPKDWSDLLCDLEIRSSDLLPRAALLTAPLNPTRVRGRTAFTFRCARRAGYGASPAMVRRSFERLDAEGIEADVRVERMLADTDNVGTQGPVWLVAGRQL